MQIVNKDEFHMQTQSTQQVATARDQSLFMDSVYLKCLKLRYPPLSIIYSYCMGMREIAFLLFLEVIFTEEIVGV
jgi:hypothetical protein